MKTPVSITAVASVSALGSSPEEIWNNYKNPSHHLSEYKLRKGLAFAAFLPEKLQQKIEELRSSQSWLNNVDKSVLLAVHASRAAAKSAGWSKGTEIGINIGSSRGATQLFEQYYESFLRKGSAEVLTSPSTTLGNISSWVAQDLESSGPEISHSVTCSTALHAVLNGVAWLNSGMSQRFLAGGSEAALTPFTMAQVQAMKIAAKKEREYPCQALNLEKKSNSMVLGEGAAMICMETGEQEKALAIIAGVGFATEKLEHPVSISANGTAFQKSMKMALGSLPPEELDAVVMHAPGTIKGDLSEYNALKAVFGEELPALTTNKWKIGHTFGASGSLSLELAVMMLQHQEFVPVPFSSISRAPQRLKYVLVNAVGFGGNAVSILLKLPN